MAFILEDETFDEDYVLKGAAYFCILDLAHSFNQVLVREKDIEKTAFRVGTGNLYEYTRPVPAKSIHTPRLLSDFVVTA